MRVTYILFLEVPSFNFKQRAVLKKEKLQMHRMSLLANSRTRHEYLISDQIKDV